MAQILASGTSLADSSEFTLAAGESATLSLFGTDFPSPGCAASIQKKASSNAWVTIGSLRGIDGEMTKVLTAVGTFRVQRKASSKAFGVDQD
ncbi:MAG: hypothetical protein V4669_13675 [Pseudomonadota bacterium]